MTRWRVQATWTVEGEQRSHAPRFADDPAGAATLRRELEDTLAHFPTLEIAVAEVRDADAALEAAATEPEPLSDDHVVHMIAAPEATTTACGLPTADVVAVLVAEMFELTGAPCPACAATRAET